MKRTAYPTRLIPWNMTVSWKSTILPALASAATLAMCIIVMRLASRKP